MKNVRAVQSELLMKEYRVSYWETFGAVPDVDELKTLYDVELEVEA